MGRRTAIVLMSCFTASTARATPNDPNVIETEWLDAGDNITTLAWAPDGSNRLFVAEKGGAVRIVRLGADGAAELLPQPFLTHRPIYTGSECGLIGLAFDPGFATNGWVYVFVTVSSSEQQIVRYTAQGDTGTSPTILVRGLPTRGANHDGGAVAVGPDGKLYWAIGDLGAFVGVDADLASLAAKVGRANRDGTVPADNPFVDGAGPNADLIWARGFRNPFRFTFQPETGALWVNVVGSGYEQIFIVGRGDHAGYNDYESNQPAGFIPPVIKYRTGGSESFMIRTGGAVRRGGVATIRTTVAHRLRKGEEVTISGVVDRSFDGRFHVTSSTPLSSDTFTVNQPGPDATSGGGTVATMNFGRCVVGSIFYDGTQFPPDYRGNYFFGDYVSGRLLRVRVTGLEVDRVDEWATSLSSPTHVSLGPDGAVYWASYVPGTIYRYRWNSTQQGLVVSSRHLLVDEGSRAAFSVSLQRAPAQDVQVSIARTAGSSVLTTPTTRLTFTPQNWRVPQPVMITAAQDANGVADRATFTVSSSGLASEDVEVTTIDDDGLGILLSRAALTIDEGASGTFTVALTAPPPSSVTVNVARTSGDPDLSLVNGAQLVFTPADYARPQTVTIAAAQDADVTDDLATFGASGGGISPASVTVTAIDEDGRAPVITSTPAVAAVVGAPYTYRVTARGYPAPRFVIDPPMPNGMSITSTTGLVAWTPEATGAARVAIRAANGVAPDAVQRFEITVSEDQAPTCSITRPVEGERIFGTSAELYGDGFDDVATIEAEFLVDGVLAYTDPGEMGHFHFQGEHARFDTTLYADGPHDLEMVVTDTSGQTGRCSVQVLIDNAVAIDAGTPDLGPKGDAGGELPTDAAIADGGGRSPDASEPSDVPSDEGCGCRSTRGPRSASATLGLLILAASFFGSRRARGVRA
jgi:MYXO-CTERM domain-containing protein